MLMGVYIFVDDDFDAPVYAEPDPDEIDEGIWTQACERVNEALENEGPANGVATYGDVKVAWRTQLKTGLSFVALGSELKGRDLESYLKQISQRYFDEVDNVREPDRIGVEDVVVDVIPPWDGADED